ncbi:MAG: hypothetical protein ACR2L4_08635 [Actinomycetota bacterium]
MSRNEEERWKEDVAIHESGHEAVALELGVPLGLVSIRPGAHFAGVAFHGSTRVRKADTFKWTSPVLQPASLRRYVETSIMVALGGDLAARYYGPIETGYVATKTDDSLEAERLASILTEMPATDREVARLAASESEERMPVYDEEKAQELATFLSPVGTGPVFLEWLRAETGELLKTAHMGRMVRALAAALLDREVIGARAARTILKEARDGKGV